MKRGTRHPGLKCCAWRYLRTARLVQFQTDGIQIDCDHLSNLAKDSTFLTPDGFGSVVDNKVYLDATQKLNISYFGKPLPDFKAQVQQFVTETNTADNGGAKRANGTSTLITVFFGTWDIWRYAELDFAYGLQAVDDSLTTLFEQLRVLADALGPEIGKAMMIVPKVPDPTWLPKWFNERTGPKGSDVHGLAQRQAVFLTQEWNRGLVEKAAAWDASTGGNIIVPEFDTWFLDQIRASQPAALGYNSQASAPGSSQVGEFTELKSPCMDHTASGGNGSGQTDAHAQTACQDASHHLFWYGPRSHPLTLSLSIFIFANMAKSYDQG